MNTKSLELTIKTGEPWEGATHLSGRRRSGSPAPNCPSCNVPMFCIFSIDGRDETLRGSPLSVGDFDYDIFVCAQGCYPYQTGYFTRQLPDGTIEIKFHDEGPDEPLRDVVLPYPVAPVGLRPIANDSPRIYAQPGEPRRPNHRICSSFFDFEGVWGGQGLSISETCPFCGEPMNKAMTIDSDYTLDIRERLGVDWVELAVLVWGDEDFLGVTHCSGCRSFGYKMII